MDGGVVRAVFRQTQHVRARGRLLVPHAALEGTEGLDPLGWVDQGELHSVNAAGKVGWIGGVELPTPIQDVQFLLGLEPGKATLVFHAFQGPLSQWPGS